MPGGPCNQKKVLDALELELQTVKSKGLVNIKLGGNCGRRDRRWEIKVTKKGGVNIGYVV